MTIEILQFVGIALITTLLVLVLKEGSGNNISMLLVIFVSTTMFLILVDQVVAILSLIETIASKSSISMVYVETILKIVGIAYIAEFGAQITKEAGQSSLASKIELAGKIIILAMAVPIITVVIETILSFIPT